MDTPDPKNDGGKPDFLRLAGEQAGPLVDPREQERRRQTKLVLRVAAQALKDAEEAQESDARGRRLGSASWRHERNERKEAERERDAAVAANARGALRSIPEYFKKRGIEVPGPIKGKDWKVGKYRLSSVQGNQEFYEKKLPNPVSGDGKKKNTPKRWHESDLDRRFKGDQKTS
jgi:hypothetical protein